MRFENLGNKFSFLAKENPQSTSLIINKKKYSFSYLNKKSDLFVSWLKKKGFKTGDTACITSIKEITTFVAIIGCLKFGIAYNILDRKSPFERLKKIIGKVSPKLIIADEILIKSFKQKKKLSKLITLNNLTKILAKESNIKNFYSKLNVTSSNIAYLMFTSGSTGEPKGVAITHGQVLNFSEWCRNEFDINKNSISTNVNPLFFDNSIFDLFGCLFNGSCIIPVGRQEIIDASLLIKNLVKYKTNIWFSVPSLIIYILNFLDLKEDRFSSFKKIIFGGEGFPKGVLKKLYNKVGKKIDLYNVYGPTECTCICSSYKINKNDFGKKEIKRFAPLGKNLSGNFKYLILDKNLKKQKKGSIGELYIGGDNVGKGYYNMKQETEKKFVQNPTHNKYIDFFYKSGDLVYKDRSNNYIYFASRYDNQIKFQGYRIELDEIENAISSINTVQENTVTFGKKNNIDEITCWIVHKSNSEKIKTILKSKLPSYMIPHQFIKIKNNLPKNSNGKVNKKLIKSNYYD